MQKNRKKVAHNRQTTAKSCQRKANLFVAPLNTLTTLHGLALSLLIFNLLNNPVRATELKKPNEEALIFAVSDKDGKSLLKKYCSQCHGPPRAKRRKPGHWNSTLVRMQNLRMKRGYKIIPKTEIIQLRKYLDQETAHDNTNN